MSSFLNDTRVKRWMKIGAKEAVIEDLTITDTLILPSDIVLTDVIIANQTNVGAVNIGCLDDSIFNLQTATNGNDGEVLKTNGNGVCYWGTNSAPGSGIVFNGTTPIAETGHHTTISVDGLGLNLSKLIENPTELNMGALNIKNANVITCNDVETDDYFSLNQELQKINNLDASDIGLTKVVGTLEADSVSANYVFNKDNGTNFIEMPNNEDAIKVYTTDFLFNGEQVATIDDIPEPFNQSLNTDSSAIFESVSSYENGGTLQFTELHPKSFNDLNIGTQNTDNLRLGGNGIFISSGNLAGVNNVSSTSISTDNIQSKNITSTSSIDFETSNKILLSAEEEIAVDTLAFTYNGFEVITTDTLPTSNPTFQDVYDNSANPVNVSLVDNKSINFKSSDNVVVLQFYSDGDNVRIEGENAIFKNLSTNSLSTQSGDFIEILGNNSMTTDRTTFTENQEFITKKYVDDAIDNIPTSNPTYQQIYNNSPTPAITDLLEGKNIKFIGEDTALVMEIDGDADLVRIPFLETDIIRKQNALLSNIFVDGTGLTANSFVKNGGLASQYLMADGSITTGPGNPFNQNLNTTDNVVFNIVSADALSPKTGNTISLSTNTAMTTTKTTFTNNQEFISKLYVDTLPPSNPFDQTLNQDDQVFFQSITSFGNGALNFSKLYPKTSNDLNIGTINTLILRLGGDGIFISSGNISGVNNVSTNSLSPKTGDTISLSANTAMTTTKTTFTNNQEFITKSYADLRYTWSVNFGGNNTTITSAQWMLPGSIRTATMNNLNIASYQLISPIASVITWVNIVRTTSTGTCSLAYAINSGTAVVITVLPIGVSSNPTPIATNISVPAGATLAMSVVSTGITSGNCLATLLLRGA